MVGELLILKVFIMNVTLSGAALTVMLAISYFEKEEVINATV